MSIQNPLQWLKDNKEKFTVELNGYEAIPYGPYLTTLPLITINGDIIDLGCGNGALLKFLMDTSGKTLVPYGVEVNDSALHEAQMLLNEFADNFEKISVNKFDFGKRSYDIIITNPFYGRPSFEEYVEKCISALKPNGRLIFRVHDETLAEGHIKSLSENSFLVNKDFKISRGCDLEFAVLDKISGLSI